MTREYDMNDIKKLGQEYFGDCDYDIKYIFVGDSATGKTIILQKFFEIVIEEDKKGQPMVNCHPFEIYYLYIQIKELKYFFNILELVAQESYVSLNRSYLANSYDCAIVVYDITNRKSFENAKNYWIKECKKYYKNNSYIVLVGNKCEQEDKRKVSYEEGKKLADEYGIRFYEATYKTGKNII